MLEKRIIYFLQIVFLLIMLNSLYYTDNFVDAFATSKDLFIYFTLTFFLVLFFIFRFSNIIRTNYIIHYNIVDILIIFYFIWNAISLFSFRKNFYDYQFWLLSCGVISYFIAKQFFSFQKKDGFYLLISVLLFIAAIQAIWGILQLYGFIQNKIPIFKVAGNFGNPGPFAIYLSTLLPLAVYFGWIYENLNSNLKYLKNISKVAFTTIIFILPATGSRIAWIIALLSLIVFLILYLKSRYKNVKLNYYKKISIAIILILFGFFLAKLYELKKDSADGRIFIWKITYEMIKDKPITGWGFSSFLTIHNNYQEQYFRNNEWDNRNKFLSDNVTYAFNEYLQITSEIGLIGLFFIISIVLIIFRYTIKNRNNESLPVSFVILFILLAALVSYPLHCQPILINFFIFLGILSNNLKSRIKFKINPIAYKFYIIIALFFLSIISVFLYKEYNAQRKWKIALDEITLKENNIEATLKHYNEAYKQLKFNHLFLYNYGATLSNLGYYKESIQILENSLAYINDADVYLYLANAYEEIGFLEKSEDNFLKAYYRVPNRIYPLYRLVNLYLKLGKEDDAVKLAIQIVKTPIKIENNITKEIKETLREFLKQKNVNL